MTLLKPFLLLLFATISTAIRLEAAGEFSGPSRQLVADSSKFARTDFEVDVSNVYPKPHDQRVVAVDMVLTAPSGKTVVQPCFFVRQANGVSTWSARFAPREAGLYSYHFSLSEQGIVVSTTGVATLTARDSSSDGFLHAHDNWTFRYDSGKLFRGIGENVGWESRSYESATYSYDLFLTGLSSNGANFFRTWSCAWNLPIEWKKVTETNRYANTSETYHPQGVARLDELTALSEKLGLHFMLCLDQHGSVLNSGQWALSNYNSANGGPCATPGEFFTNTEAKAQYKNRLRYMVARWACSTSIGAWELFNEIDNAVFEGVLAQPPVTLWHAEMSAYLKQIDPYGHPVTTSISWRDVAGIYDLPSIDFNQRHTYNNTASIPSVISQYVTAHNKPFVDGEFAWDWDWNHLTPANASSFDYDFKYGMWYGLFSPTPIVPMTWWWEMFHEHGMIPYMRGIRIVNDRMLAAGKGSFVPVYPAAPGLHLLGVRCGNTLFIHAHNYAGSSKSPDIRIPFSDTESLAVEVLDPETRVTSNLGLVPPVGGALVLPSVSLNAREQKVFILSFPTKITSQPQAQGVSAGGRAVFQVEAINGVSYQWTKDGSALAGATKSSLVLSPATSADAGSYRCLVSGPSGMVESEAALLTLVPAGALRLKNISTRALVGTGANIEIGGFAVRGPQPKRVLIRAAGPALTLFKLTNVVEDPILEIYSGQTLLYRNDDWDPALAPVFHEAGAFAWTTDSKDAALDISLGQGTYTAQVSGKNGGTGTALVEIYDLDPASGSYLTNLSTRSLVGTGSNVQIAGFVIEGTAPKRVILRAGGPSLVPFGLTGTLSDPVLQVFSGSELIYQNNEWDAFLKEEFALVGAFSWIGASKDAALMLSLPPGSYTAQVSGTGGGTGVAIVEVYEAP